MERTALLHLAQLVSESGHAISVNVMGIDFGVTEPNPKRHIHIPNLVWSWWCVGWYDAVILSCLVSSIYSNCVFQDSLYHNMYIGTMWHCALVSCIPSQFIGLVLGCGLSWCWVSLCAPFTISLIEFYLVMIFVRRVVTITEIFMAILFIFNCTLTFCN